MTVHVPASGTLRLSQAVGDPITVTVSGLVLVFTAGQTVRVRLEGQLPSPRIGSPGESLSMRNGRDISDLECTNPGLLDQLRHQWPHLPWYL